MDGPNGPYTMITWNVSLKPAWAVFVGAIFAIIIVITESIDEYWMCHTDTIWWAAHNVLFVNEAFSVSEKDLPYVSSILAELCFDYEIP